MPEAFIPQSTWKDILDELVGAGNAFDGAEVHLFKNNYTPDDGTELSDLIEADFTGYAGSATVVWNAAGYLPDGTAVVTGDLKTFTVGSTPTVLNTVYGMYLADAGGTKLLVSKRFATPIVLTIAGQIISVVPSYPAYQTP